MAAVGNLLGIARSAVLAHQASVNTTSQNIANAQTEGYSRRRVELQASAALFTPFGSIGTGVQIRDFARIRDTMLDDVYRQQASGAAGGGVRSELLGRIQDVLGEPSETGLASALDAFWSSWSSLANTPTSDAAKSVVRASGERVATLLNQFAGRYDQLEQQSVQRLDASLREANELAKGLAALNQQIVSAEVGGHSAGDLRDQRDLMLDRLAQLGPTRVLERADGSVAVYLENRTLVDGSDAKQLSLLARGPNGEYRIGISGSSDAILLSGGTLGETVRVLNDDLPAVRRELDALAKGIVEAVNGLHNPLDADGAQKVPGSVNFFDPSGITAGSIKLSAEVAAGAGAVLAGEGGKGNDIALKMAALRTEGGNKSLARLYQDTITGLGLKVAGAERDQKVADTLAAQADARRQSVSGVSMDEEMIQLIRHQQAYTAAARLVNVADEMIQTVLNMIR
jgi:flagellar hook-associated protein 1 FlgK